MSHAYLVLEGPSDIHLLQCILPQGEVENVCFVDGKGKYGAESLARSLAATRDVPVALLIDADTSDETLIAQKRQDLTYLIRQISAGAPFRILLAVPTIETIFFADRKLLEQLLERQLTDLEWQLGQRQPRELLETVAGANFVEGTLARLSKEQIESLRQHPLVEELMAFLMADMQVA
ncbi:MAG: hypothetical protein F6K19_14885 [Cyanothece sp. SIO1E1]|nr:hypothetical protein [Cyanothece sp. SIO1E1]